MRTLLAGAGALVALAAFAARRQLVAPQIPAHMLHHPVVEIPDLLTVDQARALNAALKALGALRVNTADTRSYATRHEHVGEALPPDADGACAHPYMVPSSDRARCVLAGRIDIGRHYILSGGVDGLKEPYEIAVSRLLSFGAYVFNASAIPIVAELFESDAFQAAARTVCPASAPVLDPFQFNFIVQVLLAANLLAPGPFSRWSFGGGVAKGGRAVARSRVARPPKRAGCAVGGEGSEVRRGGFLSPALVVTRKVTKRATRRRCLASPWRRTSTASTSSARRGSSSPSGCSRRWPSRASGPTSSSIRSSGRRSFRPPSSRSVSSRESSSRRRFVCSSSSTREFSPSRELPRDP